MSSSKIVTVAGESDGGPVSVDVAKAFASFLEQGGRARLAKVLREW